MIITKTIKITAPQLPPDVDFIIENIKKEKITPLRWAIVDVKGNELILNVSGCEMNI